MSFLTLEAEAKLLAAPVTVQRTYQSTDDWLEWWSGVFNLPEPTQQQLDETFWSKFVELGGTDDDFAWMVAAHLCFEDDRDALEDARAAA